MGCQFGPNTSGFGQNEQAKAKLLQKSSASESDVKKKKAVKLVQKI